MKRFARRVVRRLSPRGDPTELGFLAWSATPGGRRNLRRIKGLRGRYAGRRCVVMGNGPSLLQVDLNLFADEVTIVSNGHFLIWDTLAYRPTFLTVEDPLVAEDRADELAQITDVTKVFPFDLKHVLPPADDSTLYVNFPRSYRRFPRFSWNAAKRIYWGGTVSFMNLQLAVHLGCNPVILVGFDHNYTVPVERTHGDVITSTTADVNHIHPDYFGPGFRWHDPRLDRMEEAYRCARRALDERGVDVFNATAGGKLEVFERVPLSELWKAPQG